MSEETVIFVPSRGGRIGVVLNLERGRIKMNYDNTDIVFISGKVKFDEPVPDEIRDEFKKIIEAGAKVVIGDAPGTDTRCQECLNELGYSNVEVYTTDDEVRHNVGGWPVKHISANGETEERMIRRQKDIAMSERATKGIIVSMYCDRLDSATSLNAIRLIKADKDILFYDYINWIMMHSEKEN